MIIHKIITLSKIRNVNLNLGAYYMNLRFMAIQKNWILHGLYFILNQEI